MNMNTKSIFSIIALAAGLQLAGAGNITGTVTLKGTPPPEKPITPVMEDPTCGKMHTEVPMTRFYVVGANNGLGDVIVMLKGYGKSTGASATPVVMDQKGCLYTPQILAVQTGQKIIIRNSDPVMHNVHAVPAVEGNAEQNAPQMQGAADLSFSFDKPENFLKFKCDVHTWMLAWVTVIDSPYFAVTDKDGKFTIKDVPPGKYTVVAMHRKLSLVTPSPATYKGMEQEVEVTADGGKADFTMEVK